MAIIELFTGKELAKILDTSPASISRLKEEDYIDYEPNTTKYDQEKATEVKSGKLVNLSQVAEILSTSKSTITQMTNAGKLEVVEIGTKEFFYKLKAIEAFKQSRVKEETEQKSKIKPKMNSKLS